LYVRRPGIARLIRYAGKAIARELQACTFRNLAIHAAQSAKLLTPYPPPFSLNLSQSVAPSLFFFSSFISRYCPIIPPAAKAAWK